MLKKIINHPTAVFFAIALGFFVPPLPYTNFILPSILITLLFINFLTIKPVFSRSLPFSLFIHALFLFLIYPLILYYLPLSLSTPLKLGLLIACITPTAIASPVVCDLINGNRSKIVAHLLAVNLISPLTYLVVIYFYTSSAEVKMPYGSLASKIALFIGLPSLLAIVLKKIRPDLAFKKEKIVKKILFLVLVFVAVSSASAKISSLAARDILLTALLTFALALLLYITGWIFQRSTQERKTQALMLGHKNIGLSLWIALANFPVETTIPLVLYIVSHHIINGFMLAIFQDKTQ